MNSKEAEALAQIAELRRQRDKASLIETAITVVGFYAIFHFAGFEAAMVILSLYFIITLDMFRREFSLHRMHIDKIRYIVTKLDHRGPTP